MKLLKIIDPKPIKKAWNMDVWDSDGDGVTNNRDCEMWNSKKQGLYHTSRHYVKSTRFSDPSMYKTHEQRRTQVNVYLKKNLVTLNKISRRYYSGRPYFVLNKFEKSHVRRLFVEGWEE